MSRVETQTRRRIRWTQAAAAAIALILVAGTAPALNDAWAAQGAPRGQDDETASSIAVISREVLRSIARQPGNDLDLIVTYRAAPGAEQETRLRALGPAYVKTLRSVRGYAVRLSADQALRLAEDRDVAWVSMDSAVRPNLELALPAIGQDPVSAPVEGLTGQGVTVAVLDSGIAHHADLTARILAEVDVLSEWQSVTDPAEIAAAVTLPVLTDATEIPDEGAIDGSVVFDSGRTSRTEVRTQPAGYEPDPFGHGTHVAGIVAASGKSSDGLYRGVAPDAYLVSVRVLDQWGAGTVSGVIAGLEWVTAHKDDSYYYGIRVVVLSLGRPVYDPAELDPLVLAVEAAWRSGLVVVCSAGNYGRNGYFTVTSPGNSRLVITAGSRTDWNTPDLADDIVSTYSSRGPSVLDHFLKPDLVAPGNRIVSLRSVDSTLDRAYPEWRFDADGDGNAEHFELSGTSMAAPMVAGAAALMLQKEPGLNNASVKARLMASASKDLDPDVLSRGAGSLDLPAAVGAAGRVEEAPSPRVLRADECCDIYVEPVGPLWGDVALWSDTALWGEAALWGEVALWSDVALWGDAALWGEVALWSDTALWSDSMTGPD